MNLRNLDRSSPERAVEHLRPETWAEANRRLIAKAISELAHELSIAPAPAEGEYHLDTDHPDKHYRFRARIFGLDHWAIDPASIRKIVAGVEAPLDAASLILELKEKLQIPAEVLPAYLDELASTLSGATYALANPGPNAEALALADFQGIETGMTAGHPIFIANNGRLGFNAAEDRAFAPEAGVPTNLVWLAARTRRVELAFTRDLSAAELFREELGEKTLESFAEQLRRRGLDPAAYTYLPVHPWQWRNRLAQLFAADLAEGDLIYLGPGEDRYLAQQSIRTFYNISAPEKRYVKTALTILNMGFTRGIPVSIASSAAAVNDYVADVVRGDEYLAKCNFGVLREVAFIGYRHRYYERAVQKKSDSYKEMSAAFWRENPGTRLRPNQRLMTMAALMHFDHRGASLFAALIRASGLAPKEWVRRYLACYLSPLLHCFYAHRLTFTPHCENTILILQDHVPVGVVIKDLAEDCGVLNPAQELPEKVRRITLRVPEEVMTLTIFTDIFDCVFRFLVNILEEHAGLAEHEFWRLVAQCVREYQRAQPNLSEEFQRYDLFAPSFLRNCLNRLQLANNRMMIDLNAAEPVNSLRFAGRLENPIARFATEVSP